MNISSSLVISYLLVYEVSSKTITTEMVSDDLGPGNGLHILEFMYGLKLDDIQTTVQYTRSSLSYALMWEVAVNTSAQWGAERLTQYFSSYWGL